MAGDAPGTAHENPAGPGVASPPAPLALYRKYRPATFAEVKGQEHVTEPLRQALRNGRVHHAYLFSGPRGCGKTSSARILARSLNCEQGPTPDPCGVCASCVALAPSGPGSIDVIEIDAASHGGVDDARDLRERAFYAPVSGRFKIYIIDEAHMVTREGFNALLKLVEEPPPHLKFVFATTEPEKVIATIRSRTHHYPFRLVPPAVLRELLEEILAAEEVSYQPAVLPLVVRAGAGSVRDALSILDQLLAGSGPEGLTYDRTVALLGYTDDSLLDEMVDAFAAGSGAAVFGTVDRVVEGGHDPRRFAADLLDRLRDLIILAAVPGAGQSGLLDAPADRLERMTEQAGRFGQAELTRAAEIISEGLIQMRGTTSPRLLLELTCAQILLPAASTGEKALLARLERLEHQLAGIEGRPGEPSGETASRPQAPARQAAAPGESGRSRDERSGQPGRHKDAVPAGTPPGASQTGGDHPEEAGNPAPDTGHGEQAGSSPGASHGGAPVSPGTGQGRDAARVDADALRQRWPEILDAVRSQRKVAWMLLNSASVQELEGGTLTIAFPSEGNARGFASSGHDQVLAGALADTLGLNVRIKAVSGGPPVPPGRPGPAGGAAPGDPGGVNPSGPPATGPRTKDQPAREQEAEGPSASGRPATDRPAPRRQGSGQRAPRAAGSAAGDASGQGSPGSGRPGGGRRTASQPASPAAGEGAPGNGRTWNTPPQQAPGFAEEDWPDDATGPEGAAGDLSGMELIRRQLGGRVIEEIEDT
ncbi:MAG TPA: DNA polymerase III subunit gamma and tau [Streptosporangiaceae bacterium]|nr:DNA polymerase III subunit gamma and tau [Streptosporangiaceae bacterium]